MPVETFGNGGTVITGDSIETYRLMTLFHALKLEAMGLKRSRRPSVLAIVKKEFGFTGGAWKVLEDFEFELKKRGLFRSREAK